MVLAGINHAQAALHQHGHQPATQYSGTGFKNIKLAYCKCLNNVLNVKFQPGEGPSRGLLRDCENDGSFADDYLDQRARGLELGQPRGDGAAEEGGAEVERDAGEPDDEHPEGDALRPVPQDLE